MLLDWIHSFEKTKAKGPSTVSATQAITLHPLDKQPDRNSFKCFLLKTSSKVCLLLASVFLVRVTFLQHRVCCDKACHSLVLGPVGVMWPAPLRRLHTCTLLPLVYRLEPPYPRCCCLVPITIWLLKHLCLCLLVFMKHLCLLVFMKAVYLSWLIEWFMQGLESGISYVLDTCVTFNYISTLSLLSLLYFLIYAEYLFHISVLYF